MQMRRSSAFMIRYRSPPLLILGMLSSSTSNLNPNPKLLLTMKPTSQNPQASHLFSNSNRISQPMTLSTRCFTGSSDPIPIVPKIQSTDPKPELDDPNLLVVVSFYKFADFPDHAELRKPLKELCQELVLVSLIGLFLFLLRALFFQCKTSYLGF